MLDTLTLEKTAKGSEEMASRRYKLTPALRTVLILVDGHSNVGEIRQKASELPALNQYLEGLLKNGFVQPRTAGAQAAPAYTAVVDVRPAAKSTNLIKWEIIDMITAVIGEQYSDRVSKRFFLVDTTSEALGDALDASYRHILLTIDEKKALEVREKGYAILSQNDFK